MTRSRSFYGVTVVAVTGCLLAGAVQTRLAAAQSNSEAPSFEVDATWPKPLPNRWLVGAVVGVAVEDTLANATDFYVEFRPSYVLGLGESKFEAAYPRIGLPVTYIIDRDGIVTDVVNGIVNSELLEGLVAG